MAPKRAASSTLLGKADTSADTATKRRRLARRSTCEQAQRALHEHFGDADDLHTDLLVKDGKTLRQRLERDGRESRSNGKRLGSRYYSGLRQLCEICKAGDVGQLTVLGK